VPGRWINKQQVKIYMNARSENKGQITAAAMAGISEISGTHEKNESTVPTG
jgi:hypothetical protein